MKEVNSKFSYTNKILITDEGRFIYRKELMCFSIVSSSYGLYQGSFVDSVEYVSEIVYIHVLTYKDNLKKFKDYVTTHVVGSICEIGSY